MVIFMVQGEGLSGYFRMSARTRGHGCARVAPEFARSRPLEVGGIQLGMTRRAFLRIVGKAEPLKNGWARATFERTEPIDHAKYPLAVGDELYVTITLDARFDRGELRELLVEKVAST
jgi:hypothetical protein